MTSFNVESTFLDLKKTYQHFTYPELSGQGVVDGGDGGKDVYEGMTQNTYLFVQEKTTLIRDIDNLSLYFQHKHCAPLPQVKQEAFDSFPFGKVKDRVCFIFQKYQQQPSLLDSLLEALVQPLMNAVKNYLAILMKKEEKATEELHSVLMIVYQLTKVRGQKYVIQYFPHQVKDLYPAISYLARERLEKSDWESRYVIMLWLGVIALVPFDLQIIDSGVIELPTESGENATEIVAVMVELGKFYLRSLTKLREAAALFLSKLFTRPDIQKRKELPKYIEYVMKELERVGSDPLQNFLVCGLYESLCNIFKRVQRSELLPLIPSVMEQLRKEREGKATNSTKKELIIRLLTRIGLTYLKPRVAIWAFKKKNKSLLNNLSGVPKTNLMTNTHMTVHSRAAGQTGEVTSQNDTEYYSDVDKLNLQDVIDMLIEGLTEKETTVREEASKGLGSIAGRLSQDMVQDILDYILDLTPTPQTRHAVCLTIAELIRRNLLAPQKVTELYPLMGESLLYEKEEGGFAVGQAVRDAACYMTWSVARAYEQGGKFIGVSLITAACFDREVGCRRASSAAFQELVGRVGDVPHGIEVLTEADYFTLGPMKNAYLSVAPFIASYQSYFKPFVEHLCYQKLRHWDLEVKRIAACSLSLMVPLNPQFFGKQVLQALQNYLKADSQHVKLGSIIGLGEILLGLKGLSHVHQMHNEMKDSVFLKSFTNNEKKLLKAGEYMEKFRTVYERDRYVDNSAFADSEALKGIVEQVEGAIKLGKIYKGKAGIPYRIYTCRLLWCFSSFGVPLTPGQINTFKGFIEENIKHTEQTILFAAVKCMKPFLKQYEEAADEKFVKGILHYAKIGQPYCKCYTLASSRFPAAVYARHFQAIFDLIETNCKITKQNNDPERRKYAIQTLEAMVEQLGFKGKVLDEKLVRKIFDILATTIEDYTMDKRGDIGSIVREESMTAMLHIIKVFVNTEAPLFRVEDDLVVRAIGLCLQQLSEKIDRVRLLAGSLLQDFFDYYQHHFKIHHQGELLAVFGQDNMKKLIRESESKIDSNLQTDVIRMEMRIQETIFSQDQQRRLIFYWNLPHEVYPLVVHLLRLQQYSYYILKGLCTSTGGISESIIKYSLQELGKYVSDAALNHPQLLAQLVEQVLQLMKNHYKQERVIVPLFKTLDYILEREEVLQWQGLRQYDTVLYYAIEKELNKTKSIVKVSSATGLFVSLLALNNQQTKTGIFNSIVKILCSDLPKARKVLADKLLLFLMSQEEFTVLTEEQTQEFIMLLSDNDFLDEKLEVDKIKLELQTMLGIQ